MENKKVFIIHGFEGIPNGAWRSWLMNELSKHDIYACSLPMPNPGEPKLAEWLEELHTYVKRNSNDDIYLVGHSLGGTTILHYLQVYRVENIKGAVLAATPCEITKNEKIIEFTTTPFDWEKINRLKDIVVIHGDNDPYVPLEQAELIAEKTNKTSIIIPNGKHLNGSAGIHELPEVLEALLEMINK